MKIYDIMYKDNVKVGVLSEDNGKYKAFKFEGDKYPYGLFGINNPKKEVNHEEVIKFIKDRVTPESREGIEDILKALGMTHYDPEEFFFKTKGREVGDEFSFVEQPVRILDEGYLIV